MVSKENRISTQPHKIKTHLSSKSICKVKSSPWEDYQSIGKIPDSFDTLVDILSIKYFPSSFSISYVAENRKIFQISDNLVYRSLVMNLKEEKQSDMKLFAHLTGKIESSCENGKNVSIMFKKSQVEVISEEECSSPEDILSVHGRDENDITQCQSLIIGC